MASDSLVSVDSASFHSPKIFVVSDYIIGVAGHSSRTNRFLDWFREGQPVGMSEPDDGTELAALVLDASGLYYYTGCYTPDLIEDPFFAIGSGAHAALAALHLGQTPAEAVALACRIDLHSGGPIKNVGLDIIGTKRPRKRHKQ